MPWKRVQAVTTTKGTTTTPKLLKNAILMSLWVTEFEMCDFFSKNTYARS